MTTIKHVSSACNAGRWLSILALILFIGSTGPYCLASEPNLLPEDGVITQSGTYILTKDMLLDRDYGIRVQADSVTIDLNGFALRYVGTLKPGILGIIASNSHDLRITNGRIGGFWFGTHLTQAQGVALDKVHFDDIPYIGANIAQSQDVNVRDCVFSNFRYDIPKEKDTYVIGINIGAEDAVISGNSFTAEYDKPDPNSIGVETVFVLFSAKVSQRCVVTHNDMAANAVLPRSYGIWIASDANVSALYNSIKNMKYGICLASQASALVSYNQFSVDPPPTGTELVESIGVSAGAPRDIHVLNNRYDGLSNNALLPEGMAAVE